MSEFRKFRGLLYRVARLMGNVGPWLELDVRKIIRRQIHRYIGARAGKFAFGGGGLGRLIRSLLGL